MLGKNRNYPLQKSSPLLTYFLLLLVVALISPGSSWAQDSGGANLGRKDSPTAMLLDRGISSAAIANEIITEHLEKSYISFSGGYDFLKAGEYADIYYEAELFQHFEWVSNEGRFLPDHHMRVNFPVRLQLRQFRSVSSPVVTPSFNPGVRVFYWYKNWLKQQSFHYLSYGFHHYSNGQNGPFYDENGDINTENGSFSTDYYEIFYHIAANSVAFDWHRIGYRRYLQKLTWEKEQTGIYQDTEISVSGHKRRFIGILDVPSSFNATIMYKRGRKLLYKNPVTFEEKEAKAKNNYQYKLDWIFSPKNWSSLSIYLRYDYGYDYYNINFQSKMSRLQLGVISQEFK